MCIGLLWGGGGGGVSKERRWFDERVVTLGGGVGPVTSLSEGDVGKEVVKISGDSVKIPFSIYSRFYYKREYKYKII